MRDTTYLVLHLVNLRFDQLREDTGAVVVHIVVSILHRHALARHHSEIFVELCFIKLLLLHRGVLRGMHKRGVLHERLTTLLFEQRT